MNTNIAYAMLLGNLIHQPQVVSPRGMPIRELLAFQSIVDMSAPRVTMAERKILEKFQFGEAAWILSGDNRVSTIGPYAKKISGFSDDGQRFFGAYGPKIIDQMSYVAQKIAQDVDTRQAVINIWRENPGLTKDVPCTLSLQFLVRRGALNCVATMRSSDAWLGWPYDVFNFSMVSWAVCMHVHAIKPELTLVPGVLFLTAGSQHLYERDVEAAKGVLENGRLQDPKVATPRFSCRTQVDDFVASLWECAVQAAATAG